MADCSIASCVVMNGEVVLIDNFVEKIGGKHIL
jgi:hypothetical protein